MFYTRTYVPVNSFRSAAASLPKSRPCLRVVDDRRRIVRREQARFGHVLDGPSLIDVAGDVLGGSRQLLRLQGGIEDPVRPLVGAGAGDPLPVAGVLRDVAVEEEVVEVLRAD